jgi:hypothetical protein
MQVPPNSEAVRDAMPVFFEMPTQETGPSVRVVLGLFNFCLYPSPHGRQWPYRPVPCERGARGRRIRWTVAPLERRDAYMAALEEASVRQNIALFAEFSAQLVEEGSAASLLPKRRQLQAMYHTEPFNRFYRKASP